MSNLFTENEIIPNIIDLVFSKSRIIPSRMPEPDELHSVMARSAMNYGIESSREETDMAAPSLESSVAAFERMNREARTLVLDTGTIYISTITLTSYVFVTTTNLIKYSTNLVAADALLCLPAGIRIC